MTDLSKKMSEDAFLTTLDELTAQYGEKSTQVRDFLRERGENPSDLSQLTPENRLAALERYTATLQGTWEPDLNSYSDAAFGYLNRLQYQGPVAKLGEKQSAILLDLSVVTKDDDWTAKSRDERIDELDLIGRAGLHVMRKRHGIAERASNATKILVSKVPSIYSSAAEKAPDGFERGVYSSATGQIHYALYSDMDATADRLEALVTLDHEGKHVLSGLEITNSLVENFDKKLAKVSHDIVKLFEMNADFMKNQASMDAHDAVYLASPEERLARRDEKFIRSHYTTRVVPADDVAALKADLADVPDFAPLIAALDRYKPPSPQQTSPSFGPKH